MDQNSNASPSTDKKTWTKRAVVAASIIAVAIIVVIILVLANQPKSQTEEASRTPAGPEEFTMTTEDRVVTYAGSPVYDACGLISFDTVRKTVNNYQTLLDMNGTDKKPSEPLTIEHNYIDRTISVPLGKDGQPHPTGATVGQEGVSSSSFVSDADANCWYGQGNDLSLGIGKTFAKVYVTQKPTPFSADFTAYLGTLQKVGSEGGIDVYVEPKTDTSGFFTSIITNVERGTAVIFKAASRELGEKGTVEISQTLSSAPKGPMNLTYPLGWSSMPNPCTLLTGEDFRRITERPASALAEDRLTLNEIGGRIMTRSCERLEVERLDNTPIAKTEVTVRVGNTEEATKKYVEDLKSGNLNEVKTEIVPLKQKVDGADDAYISIAMSSKGEAVGYELNVRVGQILVVFLAKDLDVQVDTAEAFENKLHPTVQRAISSLKRD